MNTEQKDNVFTGIFGQASTGKTKNLFNPLMSEDMKPAVFHMGFEMDIPVAIQAIRNHLGNQNVVIGTIGHIDHGTTCVTELPKLKVQKLDLFDEAIKEDLTRRVLLNSIPKNKHKRQIDLTKRKR